MKKIGLNYMTLTVLTAEGLDYFYHASPTWQVQAILKSLIPIWMPAGSNSADRDIKYAEIIRDVQKNPNLLRLKYSATAMSPAEKN